MQYSYSRQTCQIFRFTPQLNVTYVSSNFVKGLLRFPKVAESVFGLVLVLFYCICLRTTVHNLNSYCQLKNNRYQILIELFTVAVMRCKNISISQVSILSTTFKRLCLYTDNLKRHQFHRSAQRGTAKVQKCKLKFISCKKQCRFLAELQIL